LGPQAPADGGPAKFRRTGGSVRPGAGGGRLAGPRGSIPGLGRVGAAAGGLERRHRAAPAAAASSPAKRRCAPSNERVWELEWMLGRVLGCLGGAGSERRRLDGGL
jgi:hypothetical protein